MVKYTSCLAPLGKAPGGISSDTPQYSFTKRPPLLSTTADVKSRSFVFRFLRVVKENFLKSPTVLLLLLLLCLNDCAFASFGVVTLLVICAMLGCDPNKEEASPMCFLQ